MKTKLSIEEINILKRTIDFGVRKIKDGAFIAIKNSYFIPNDQSNSTTEAVKNLVDLGLMEIETLNGTESFDRYRITWAGKQTLEEIYECYISVRWGYCRLRNLVSEGESVRYFTVTDDYREHYFIMDDDTTDIAGSLEDTLHRILDNGGNAEDVKEILDAEIIDLENSDSEDDYVYLDLGYVITGLIEYISDKNLHPIVRI